MSELRPSRAGGRRKSASGGPSQALLRVLRSDLALALTRRTPRGTHTACFLRDLDVGEREASANSVTPFVDGTAVLLKSFDPKTFLKGLLDYRPNSLPLVPPLVLLLLQFSATQPPAHHSCTMLQYFLHRSY